MPVAQPNMQMDPADYRRILGHWVTGVAVVAARDPDGHPCGLTANAVTSLSLDPPLVLVCIEKAADSHDCIRAAGAFSINILAAEQELMARRFAGEGGSAKFDGVAHRLTADGVPVLVDALAWVECRVRDILPGGDHTIFVGHVTAGDARPGAPLAFFRGGYGRYDF
jgi:flavin reductase (DIM6/NTAB) family NADH-FMN oxidoreductase RutF